MRKFNSVTFRGFTLIELMVVLAILSTALTLIGPNLFKSYQKAKYQTDIINLRENLKAISRKAFLNNRKVKIEFMNNKIHYQYLSSNKPMLEKSFKNITFPQQSLLVSSAGFINQLQVIIITGEKTVNMSLLEINSL